MKKKTAPSKASRKSPSEMHALMSFVTGAIFVSVFVSVFLSFLLVRTTVHMGMF